MENPQPQSQRRKTTMYVGAIVSDSFIYTALRHHPGNGALIGKENPRPECQRRKKTMYVGTIISVREMCCEIIGRAHHMRLGNFKMYKILIRSIT